MSVCFSALLFDYFTRNTTRIPLKFYNFASCPCKHGKNFNTSAKYFNISVVKKATPPWKILFYGTDEFSLITLEKLNNNRLLKIDKLISCLEIVCLQTKNNCLPSPVKKYAQQCDLKIHTWPDVRMGPDDFDVGVVASFGRLIPEKMIELIPYGILNVHPSLLPRWRGPAPIPHTVLNGDTHTGVTVMRIRPKRFDVGPIVCQETVEVPSGVTSTQLMSLLGKKGADMLIHCLSNLPLMIQKEYPQPTDGVTSAPKISKEMAWVDFEQQTCLMIDRLYRSISHMFSLQTVWHGIPIKLIKMVNPEDLKGIKKYLDNKLNEPGFVVLSKRNKVLCIRCKDGWVGFHKVKLSTYKIMSAHDFYNGFLNKLPPNERYMRNRSSLTPQYKQESIT